MSLPYEQFPLPIALDENGRHFWEPESQYQRCGGWLRHSHAVTWLGRPAGLEVAIRDAGATCGPISFSAVTGVAADSALAYFPEIHLRRWTTRTDMTRALDRCGLRYAKRPETWPTAGLCLIQFTGAWTERNYPPAALQHTHWIAVLGAYVYDINWEGWLPRENWEEIVLDELLLGKPLADGWRVLTAYELLDNVGGHIVMPPVKKAGIAHKPLV